MVAAVAAAFSVQAQAQSVDALRPLIPTPGELAPRPERAQTDLRRLPAQPKLPRELAKPQEELTLDVRGYALSANAPPELLRVVPTLLAPYVGPQRGWEDLVSAAAEVTRYLQRESGYYLGYAYLPEQDPRDGIVRIEVLEGRLDRVQLAWSEGLPVQREVVEAYLAALKPGEILRVGELERVVFLINDLRGITARFEVTAGAEPGTAALVVTPSAERTWSGKAEVDDFGSVYLGRLRAGVLGSVNSLLGRGDSITGNVLASKGLQFALLGANTPLGADGLKLGASLSLVRYRLDDSQFPSALDVNGDATAFSVYALYPWVRSRNLNLFVLGTLDANRYADRQGVVGLEVQKSIRRISLGLTGDLRDNLFGGAVNTFDASLARGQVAYREGDAHSSEDSPGFRRLIVGANRLENLIEGRLLLYASLRMQRAFANLDTNEQFRIGGPDAVRAFAPGEGTADSGEVATVELRLLPPDSLLGRTAREMVASAFLDAAHVRLRHDPSLRAPTFVNSASYAGVGVALSWEHAGEYALRASLAKPVRGSPSAESTKSLRLYFQLTRNF